MPWLTRTAAVSALIVLGCSSEDGPSTSLDAGAGQAGSGGAGTGGQGGKAGAGGAGAGGVSGSGAGGAGGSSGSGASGGVPPADAPFPCGTESCLPEQWCVHPCCGGAPLCFPIADGGVCPSGSQSGCSAPNGLCSNPAACCQMPCTPPAPYCADQLPVGCFVGSQTRICSLTCA